MTRTTWWIAALGLAAVAAVGMARRRQQVRNRSADGPSDTLTGPVAVRWTPGRAAASPDAADTSGSGVPAIPLAERRSGRPEDRGSGSAVQLDLSQARTHHLEPVVEFLTYLQQRRGDSSHLLFVRYDDLDALAEREGAPVADFLSRLDQLGVVVSQN